MTKQKKEIEKFEKIFNIEMQTGHTKDFEERFTNYGFTLNSENNSKPVIALGILNYKRTNIDFKEWSSGEYKSILLYYGDKYNHPKKLKENVVDTFFFIYLLI